MTDSRSSDGCARWTFRWVIWPRLMAPLMSDSLLPASREASLSEIHGMLLAHAAMDRADRDRLWDDRSPVGAPGQFDAARVELTVGDGFGDDQGLDLSGKDIVSLVVVDAQVPDLLDGADVGHAARRLRHLPSFWPRAGPV